jgi:hypothetical protein
MKFRHHVATLVITLAVVTVLTVTALYPQTFVVGTDFSPTGTGVFKTYTCANPGAGAEWTCTVPNGKVWRIHTSRVTLVTSATVATRRLNLITDNGTTTLIQVPAADTQTASLTRNYNIDHWSSTVTAINNEIFVNHVEWPLLGPGYRFRSSTDNVQAGDDYGAPVVLVEEWSR